MAHQPHVLFVLLIHVWICGLAVAQKAPTAETLKQALEKRLQALKPSGMTERNVLFQEVRPGKPIAGSYPFQVTGVVRDYGPGYPANKFYGETCVGRMNQMVYTLSPDAFGVWQVEGRMTLSGSEHECKKNPAAGVSSIPLSALQGTPAPSGAIAPAEQIGSARQKSSSPQGVAVGSYECWANGQARLLLSFTVRDSGHYVDSEGKSGAFTLDPATTRISFKGGMLDGVMPKGFYTMYHTPKGIPTVSFRNSQGNEVSFCERAR